MSKIITFSTKFPNYHPKAGQPTHFVEQILSNLIKQGKADTEHLKPSFVDISALNMDCQKRHTIRKGNRFKVGDKFSARIWSGNPYNSKQIIFAPEIEVRQIWDIEINLAYETIKINGKEIHYNLLDVIAKNDGLSFDDFDSWFGKDFFEGQIICWCDDVSYYGIT